MIRIRMLLTILASTGAAAAAEQQRSLPEPGIEFEQSPRQDRSVPENAVKSAETGAEPAAARGELSAFALTPIVPRAVNGLALAGYDGAASGLRARSAVDGRLVSFLAARVEYEHGPANGPDDRVSLGLRARFLNQAAHGVELSALLFYQPRDFREEGHVAFGLSLARRIDRLTLVLNPLVGSDPEGDDQSVEVRLAGLYRTGSLLVLGLDSRARYNFSEDEKRAGHSTIDWEAQGGVSAAFGVGPILLTTLVGPTLLRHSDVGLDGATQDRATRAGLLAMGGVGASF